MAFPARRLRRLRRTPALRRLVAETRLSVDDLVAPLFVREGIDAPNPIESLPGVVQHTRESLRKEAARLVDLGVPALVLFGVPATKDARGSGAWDPDGIVQVALQDLREEVGDQLVLMADLCLDEYTDHGHCGLVRADGSVDNDATLELYAQVAIAQADAGADVCAPSGMMDGQVAAIRAALDGSGHEETIVLAYAAKYASALYGPFRDAVDVTIAGGGDRKGYQQDVRNRRESLAEVLADVDEGADMVMVKPALAYLDVISDVRAAVDVPVVAYHVSGEYSMVKAAAERGWIDGDAVAMEHVTAIKRAGADVILTYFAAELAELLGVTNDDLFTRASAVTPGGVNSPVRAFRSVGGTPYFVASGQGATVTDVEGRTYVDYVQSYGASILGHAHPVVVEAIRRAAGEGTTYGAPTEREVLLAEAVVERVPGVEMVRLVSSGTEAAMSAVRLARGATGRDKILKFAGCYHGHSDSLLAAGGSGIAQQGISGSAGVTTGAVADTIVAPYNVVPEIGDDVAVVCVEAIAGNMGLVLPEPGFLEGLRAACDRAGALLLFDEVITGFRVGWGGATERFGVTPDLWCFGKVIGGGLPVGAFAGRRDLMEHLAPLGEVYQAGTLSGNPVATAAGLAVLHELDAGAYEQLEATATALADGLREAINGSGLSVQVPRGGTLVGLHGGETPVTDYEQAKLGAETGWYRTFFHAMLDDGIALAPGAYEALFPSLAHTPEDVERTVEAAARAAGRVVAAAG